MLLKLTAIVSLLHFCTAIVSEDDVTFRLFTRDDPVTGIFVNRTNLQNMDINELDPIKFIVHGWRDSATTAWVPEMKDSYLRKAEFNVFLLDWSKGSMDLYPVSACNTRDVGKYLGDFIIALNTEKGIPFTNVHVVAHSLGAHIGGFAGKRVKGITRKTFATITAMDAAGPLFYGSPADQRLSVGDATFVQAIHTDGFKYGFGGPIGDVDFYPNGGMFPQPGCLLRRRRDLTDTISLSCSHSMAHVFTNEAINSVNFVATKCDCYLSFVLGWCTSNSKAIMGENINTDARGTYYLSTNPSPLYARGNEM